MGAAEILLGTHVEIIVMDVVEHGINACHCRDADRPWRQSWVAIGVVWTLDAEQVVVDALQVESLPGVFDGRIGLQEAFPQDIRHCEASDGCSTCRQSSVSHRCWLVSSSTILARVMTSTGVQLHSLCLLVCAQSSRTCPLSFFMRSSRFV